jgi:uncharacterized protein YfiM (DUF2279 family)
MTPYVVKIAAGVDACSGDRSKSFRLSSEDSLQTPAGCWADRDFYEMASWDWRWVYGLRA